ncbi:sulfate reduction electron transfer complex DsrMKJOP subunit DsrO [Chloroflexota bacterium]
MQTSRRNFLKAAGLAALGFTVVKPALAIFSHSKPAEVALSEGPVTAHRFAMVVDTKACEEAGECTECIDACHLTHNVPKMKDKDDEIKWIWKAPHEKVFPEEEYEFLEGDLKNRPVLVLCNHCTDPPCVKYCPTKATWKREEDGIVMIDYHRCIGCRYCMAGCPYGARSFNWRNPRPFIEELNPDFPTRSRGVVEKCNFCTERLVKGLLPACVEACPQNALTFGDLEDPDSKVREILRTKHFIRRLPELATQPNVYYLE